VRNLDELLATLSAASARVPFAAAWFDTTARGASLGRGFVTSGRYAEPHEAPPAPPRLYERIAVPFYLPNWFMGGWSIRPFNVFWYHSHQPRSVEGVVHPQPFLYPLDAVRHWNRLYGRRGMVQYQCVVPGRGDGAIFRELIEIVARMGGASPVAVIKDCGAEGRGTISFPMPGMSLALDLPYLPGHTQALVDALNERVIAAGGRIYLSKDALTRREHFAAMEPRLARWNDVRRKWDPERTITSALAQRLLDAA
jgi:FAD/FMN-containing dehydrogenase